MSLGISISVWITILLIVAISGIVKGTTGFGFALFSLPLLIHFISIKNLIPLITMFNLFSSIMIIIQTREFKVKRSVLLLSVTGSLGVILGTLMLKYLQELALKFIASVVLVVLSAIFLTGYRFKIRKIRRGNTIAGVISGFLGGSLSVSGPPLALFLTSLNIDSKNFRYTFAWFSIVTALVAIFDYMKIGFINTSTIHLFIISLPVLITSIWLGKIINRNIKTVIFYKGVIVITMISGILLFYTSLNNMKVAGITIKTIGTIFRISN